MGIRETLNKSPAIAAGAVMIVVAAAAWLLWPGGGGPRLDSPRAYFTSDDGATYFVGPSDSIVPYTKDSKEVVRAHVFKCKSKKPFVAFLQRYTPQAQEALRDAQEARKVGREPKNPGLVAMVDQIGSEWKKPGVGNPWVKGQSGDVVVGDAAALCDNKPGEIGEPVVP